MTGIVHLDPPGPLYDNSGGTAGDYTVLLWCVGDLRRRRSDLVDEAVVGGGHTKRCSSS